MQKIQKQIRYSIAFVLFATSFGLLHGQSISGNSPPSVSILWPRQGYEFRVLDYIKIKAETTDLDGSVVQVQFYAGTNLIGISTNSPFAILWSVARNGTSPLGSWNLKAVAVDKEGSKSESAPVSIKYNSSSPPSPVLEITSPLKGAIFPAPATFGFSAELLASIGDSGPVDFYVGTNLVERIDRDELFTVATQPYSITVSNLAEGNYQLRAQYMGGDWPYCDCRPITISVVKLGVRSASLTTDGRLQFEAVTSFPGRDTLIQRSTNLLDWISVSTNRPSTNTFTFVESEASNSLQRFYRVILPP